MAEAAIVQGHEGDWCIDSGSGHACEGPVTGQPSHAGTGTIIYHCEAGHRAADEHARQVQERYPDSPVPPPGFDPTYAGERWNEDD
ncbi:hypothetical protein C9F11_10225 [Streptomyces sp. YIM 121038]|uniref:hypothetical protein n=1 Tax=Streptomyces sp. YIM 121038 TaxID=2136401 RepID=UPI0011104F66|nr:hypothetical protein [Streptomyces sp. YIM 121038]QCX75725.1 hypothetical protein C9F11_10225 [Streptomyces sp. YIM 121038]